MTPSATSSLTAARRSAELARLAAGDVVDLLVVGLGATGAGVALDAASRGLRVAAIDAHDLAFGTSRWSSKLVHGGLRYLASGQVGVAHECAVERGVLMARTAPHLARALPFVLPLTPAVSRPQVALLRSGYFAGELLRASAHTSRRLLPRPRRLSAVETLRFAPALRPDGLRGGLLSWDGQLTDDARLVVALARTAAAHGARILTRCRAGRLSGSGAEVTDTLSGERFEVRARAVVNATGVWAGGLVEGVRLRPSRGTHIVLRDTSVGSLGVGLQVLVGPGRFGLVLPQDDGRLIVGLTDEPADGPIPDEPEPTEGEIRFLLDMLGSVLDLPVRRVDVIGVFSGLRPLLDSGGGRTADLSRRHAVITSRDGVVTVVGGKLTTYRRMAEDAVDAVADRLASTSGNPPVGRCRTARLPLVGAVPQAVLDRMAAPRRLVQRYGAEAPAVLVLADDDPSLLEPVAPGLPVTGVELAWAVRHEGALDVSDLLDRRTRLGLVAADRQAAQPAAERALETAAHMPGR
jgi:glycerol-3-phosphate dehydrogenase